MNFLSKKTLITDQNFTLLKIGSVISLDGTIYDVFNIAGGLWPLLLLSCVSRDGKLGNRVAYINPANREVYIIVKGLF